MAKKAESQKETKTDGNVKSVQKPVKYQTGRFGAIYPQFQD